jgi:hypothetical protein
VWRWAYLVKTISPMQRVVFEGRQRRRRRRRRRR